MQPRWPFSASRSARVTAPGCQTMLVAFCSAIVGSPLSGRWQTGKRAAGSSVTQAKDERREEPEGERPVERRLECARREAHEEDDPQIVDADRVQPPPAERPEPCGRPVERRRGHRDDE